MSHSEHTKEPFPKTGTSVKIVGNHPWSGSRGVVLGVETIGFMRRDMARVRLSREDAMDGHECFAEAIQLARAGGCTCNRNHVDDDEHAPGCGKEQR